VPTKKRYLDKAESLRRQGTLNPRPHAIKSELFQDSDFFDPRDLVQTKYEMLRGARVEGNPVGRVAATFGLSRPTFYQARAAFERHGLAGLIPRKRGPRQAHKLTPEVVAFVEQSRAQDEALGPRELANLIKECFGISIHPRTIERTLRRGKKN